MNRRMFIKHIPSIGAALTLPCVASAQQKYFVNDELSMISPVVIEQNTVQLPDKYKPEIFNFTNTKIMIQPIASWTSTAVKHPKDMKWHISKNINGEYHLWGPFYEEYTSDSPYKLKLPTSQWKMINYPVWTQEALKILKHLI